MAKKNKAKKDNKTPKPATSVATGVVTVHAGPARKGWALDVKTAVNGHVPSLAASSEVKALCKDTQAVIHCYVKDVASSGKNPSKGGGIQLDAIIKLCKTAHHTVMDLKKLWPSIRGRQPSATVLAELKYDVERGFLTLLTPEQAVQQYK